MATEFSNTQSAEEDVAGLLAGSGIVLFEAAAVTPGLLPVLLLLLPFVLPLVVLGAAAGVLIALPFGAWRLIAWAIRPRNRGVPTSRSTTA